jgi:hypothetical protein
MFFFQTQNVLKKLKIPEEIKDTCYKITCSNLLK